MALEIDNAQYGYDKSKINDFIENDVNAKCKEPLKNALENYADMFTTIQDHWQGQAEKDFENAFKDTVKTLEKQIDAAFDDLKNEIRDVGGAMGKMDENLLNDL